MNRRETALKIWRAGVDAVDGYSSTRRALKTRALQTGKPANPDQIIAVGKAASSMMRAALDQFGDVPSLVVTKDGHGGDLPAHVRLIEAAHPVPDARSLVAGRAVLEVVAGMQTGAHLLLLVSGGASSLAEDLVAGKTLDDLKALNQRLLGEGLDIGAMNVERRKISRIKGGGLLGHFTGGSVHVLAISDVPGDDLAVICSGLGLAPEKRDFARQAEIVGSNTVARAAAKAEARDLGQRVLACEEALHDDLETLARDLGKRIRGMGRGVMILGGEPTVLLPPNPGRGGRNQALALALARTIAGIEGLVIVVAGTDGSDGPTDAAGGVVDGTTWGPGAAQALQRADSGSYLAQNNALLVTGPTGTNVMDLLVALRA